MGWIVLEALLALAVLLAVVWWTLRSRPDADGQAPEGADDQ